MSENTNNGVHRLWGNLLLVAVVLVAALVIYHL